MKCSAKQQPGCQEDTRSSSARDTATSRAAPQGSPSSSPLAVTADQRGRESRIQAEPAAMTQSNPGSIDLAPNPLPTATAGRRILGEDLTLPERLDQPPNFIQGARPRQSTTSSNQRSAAATVRKPTSQIWEQRSGWTPHPTDRRPLPLPLGSCTRRRLLPHPLRPATPTKKRRSNPGPTQGALRRNGEEREWERRNEHLMCTTFFLNGRRAQKARGASLLITW
jgi:hypothetical protein